MNGLKPQYSDRVKFEIISIDDPDVFRTYQRKYSLQGAPTVVVLDPAGNIVLNQAGIGNEAEYKAMLESALKKASR